MLIEQDITQYIHLSKYSRWMEELNRRETWSETVDRLWSYWYSKGFDIPDKDLEEVMGAVRSFQVMPSMRSLMTAGPALDRDNAAGFNCAAIAVNHPRVFDEIFYLLMCG